MMNLPEFKVGDLITVYYKTVEGDKARTHPFQGIVIRRRGTGNSETVTVRKISSGIGVERIFPIYSPFITKIVVKKKGSVRKSKLYYLRKRRGKRFAVKER